MLAALEGYAYVSVAVHLYLIGQAQVAEVQRQTFGPDAGLALVDLLVQAAAVYLTAGAEEVQVGVDVQLDLMGEYCSAAEHLRGAADADGGVLRQVGKLRAAACKVEYFKCEMFHCLSFSLFRNSVISRRA